MSTGSSNRRSRKSSRPASCFRRIDKIVAKGASMARTVARRRSARPLADRRGTRCRPIRHGAHRPHFVHSRRGVPCRETVGSDPRASGPISDSGRTGLPHAPISCASSPSLKTHCCFSTPSFSRPKESSSSLNRRPSKKWRGWPRMSTPARKTSAPGGCTR